MNHFDEHGGQCCGISHLHGFEEWDDDWYYDHDGWRLNYDELTLPFGHVSFDASRNTKRLTNDKKGENDGPPTFKKRVAELVLKLRNVTPFFNGIDSGGNGQSQAIEVVLAEAQLSSWQRPVTAVGFRRVFSFRNPNTGNQCHVYYGQFTVAELDAVVGKHLLKKEGKAKAEAVSDG